MVMYTTHFSSLLGSLLAKKNLSWHDVALLAGWLAGWLTDGL